MRFVHIFVYITYNICFKFSISLLKFSLCSSSPLLSLVRFFRNVTSNIPISKLLVSILLEIFLLFFWDFILCFHLEYISLSSHFVWLFVVVVCLYNLGEIIASPALEGKVLSGSIPMLTMCAQWLWQEDWSQTKHEQGLFSGFSEVFALAGWAGAW